MPDTYDLAAAVDPQRLAEHARATFPTDPAAGHAGHGPLVSVREVEYRGHTIRIQTSYEITIDGQPVGGHVIVGNDGQVHYHPIPNQHFASAVDMVKRVIDLIPPDRPDTPPHSPDTPPHSPAEDPDGPHSHHPGTGPHPHHSGA